MKNKKKWFEFRESKYKREAKYVYPYSKQENEDTFYIEQCEIININAIYNHRIPQEMFLVLKTQTQGQIIIDSFGEYLDIDDFFPKPKPRDLVIAIFKKKTFNYTLMGFTPNLKVQLPYDYCIQFRNRENSNLIPFQNPWPLPISHSGKRIHFFKYAFKNKIGWVVNELLNSLSYIHDLDPKNYHKPYYFDLTSFLLDNQGWELIEHIFKHDKCSREYFLESIPLDRFKHILKAEKQSSTPQSSSK